MKKTLMVLSFALCASLAFAQTATPNRQGEVKAANKAAQIQNSYNSSIFTKDADVLKTVDFHAEDSADYYTGVVTGGLERHSQNYAFASWRRIAGVDDVTLTAEAETYPAVVRYFGGSNGVAGFCNTVRSVFDTTVTSSANGWMIMSMMDQNTPASGNFNAFIRIDGIDASTAQVVDIRFYQYYIKYYDYCYIDYSTNGSSWTPVEINVDGVDISVNASLLGFATYSLPVAAAGNSNLSIRIRYTSLDGHRGNAYGYVWMLDDVEILAGNPDRLRQFDQEFVEGNYGLIPQNMQINPAWYSLVQNNGANVRNNVTATLHHLNAAQDTDTEVAQYNNQTIAISSEKGVIIDKHGWIYADSMDYRGWYGYGFVPHGTGDNLPTATTGDNYMYVTVESDPVTLTYDTMYYNVTPETDGFYRWGHDNGVLAYYPTNQWLYGFVQDGENWWITEDADDVNFYNTGYQVTTRYTTDDNVPEGWVVRGVELVASPVSGYHNTGSKISALLFRDEYDGGSVGFQTVLTGANPKEVAASEVNDTNIIGRNYRGQGPGYRELGQYNSVIITFPEQPALEPNTTYRVGYSIEEDSYFAVAREATGWYREASDTDPENYDVRKYFADNEATAKYAHFYKPNQYQSYFLDPSYGGTGRNSGFAYYSDNNPMIRLLVGPAQAVNRVNINIECDSSEYGSAIYGGEEVCGNIITPAEGSSLVITGAGATGCGIAHCYVDGVEVMPYDEDTEEGDPHLMAYHDTTDNSFTWQYQFVNVQGDHTIKFVFYELPEGSIDPIASGVKMNLQPNPATSQVRLNIEGVNGRVNCTLIDMSGRVVYNQNINAETANVINLNNLAKGAYFVRITNDQFSKVEKLIVR